MPANLSEKTRSDSLTKVILNGVDFNSGYLLDKLLALIIKYINL